jgi:hypothetical protein
MAIGWFLELWSAELAVRKAESRRCRSHVATKQSTKNRASNNEATPVARESEPCGAADLIKGELPRKAVNEFRLSIQPHGPHM